MGATASPALSRHSRAVDFLEPRLLSGQIAFAPGYHRYGARIPCGLEALEQS